MVRLSNIEIEILKNNIYNIDNNAEIYIFGSRAIENKKGGDIDILIISKIINRIDKRKIRLAFFKEFGEQKLDIILEENINNLSEFSKNIIEKAIKI